MRRVLVLVAVVLLLAAAYVLTRTVVRDGVSCGSVVRPMSAAVKGPPGTNPTPCDHVHTGDGVVGVALIAGFGVFVLVVVRARPKASADAARVT